MIPIRSSSSRLKVFLPFTNSLHSGPKKTYRTIIYHCGGHVSNRELLPRRKNFFESSNSWLLPYFLPLSIRTVVDSIPVVFKTKPNRTDRAHDDHQEVSLEEDDSSIHQQSSYPYHHTIQNHSIDRNLDQDTTKNRIRLSQLIASYGKNLQMSRRAAEKLIRDGEVTIAGQIITDPTYPIHNLQNENIHTMIKVSGQKLLLHTAELPSNSTNPNTSSHNSNNPIRLNTTIEKMKTRVWIAHKLKGELVTEQDPDGRPTLLERLQRGGVGKPSRKAVKKGQTSALHLKAIGRLDMMTEGLVILTNDGMYARDMELPKHRFHRTYRVRVHGLITSSKLDALRRGLTIDGVHYRGMKVSLEMQKGGQRVKGGATNSWVHITCCEGKNRQIRKTLDHLGLKVTRLIRISFGDYDLNTIPPGMAIEVPVKDLDTQKRKGQLITRQKLGRGMNSNYNRSRGSRSSSALKKGGNTTSNEDQSETYSAVQWVDYHN